MFLALFLAVATMRTLSRNGDVGYPDPPLAPLAPGERFYSGHNGQGYGMAILHMPQFWTVTHTWNMVLAGMTALPLAVRRRYPLTALWGALMVSLTFHTGVRVNDASIFTFIICLIAAYSAMLYSPYRTAAVTSLVIGTLLVAKGFTANIPDITPGFVPFLLLIPLGLAANAMNSWKQRLQALEGEQEAATRLAVERERARIASELHDVVTHNVSVMVVQAGAARKIMDKSPEQAREALLAVENGGRAAMAELRHVMGLLTMSSDGSTPAATADLAPQPGLEQLATLAARVRSTGVPVELSVTGTPSPLPSGVDLAAYRVVQEALTNTVKHAVGAQVQISVDYQPRAVRLEVVDSGGTPAASAGSGNGRGLIGLRERLAVYGGTLQAGKRLTGGYRVSAVIPVEET